MRAASALLALLAASASAAAPPATCSPRSYCPTNCTRAGATETDGLSLLDAHLGLLGNIGRAVDIMRTFPGVQTDDRLDIHVSWMYLCCVTVDEIRGKVFPALDAVAWAAPNVSFTEVICNHDGSLILHADDASQAAIGAIVARFKAAIEATGIAVRVSNDTALDYISGRYVPCFLDELDPVSGAIVQSFPLPTVATTNADGSTNWPCVMPFVPSGEGYPQLTSDRQAVTFGCIAAVPGAAVNHFNVRRVMAAVFSTGVVDTRTSCTDCYMGGTATQQYAIRGVTSYNVTSGFIMNGFASPASPASAGVRFVPYGGSSTSQVITTQFARFSHLEANFPGPAGGPALVLSTSSPGLYVQSYIRLPALWAYSPATIGVATPTVPILTPGLESAQVWSPVSVSWQFSATEDMRSVFIPETSVGRTGSMVVLTWSDALMRYTPFTTLMIEPGQIVQTVLVRTEERGLMLYYSVSPGTYNNVTQPQTNSIRSYNTATGEGQNITFAAVGSYSLGVTTVPFNPDYAAPSRSETRTASPTPTSTPTGTGSPSATSSGTPSPSVTPSNSPSPSVMPSGTPGGSETASGTPPPTPSPALCAPLSIAPAPFTPGNIVVLRLGSGLETLTAQASISTAILREAFLDEYSSSTGARVQSIALPTFDPAMPSVGGCTVSLNPTEGGISASADASCIVVPCWAALPGTLTSDGGQRAVYLARPMGNIELGALFTDSSADAGIISPLRSALTPDGSIFLLSTGNGIRAVDAGSRGATAVDLTNTSLSFRGTAWGPQGRPHFLCTARAVGTLASLTSPGQSIAFLPGVMAPNAGLTSLLFEDDATLYMGTLSGVYTLYKYLRSPTTGNWASAGGYPRGALLFTTAEGASKSLQGVRHMAGVRDAATGVFSIFLTTAPEAVGQLSSRNWLLRFTPSTDALYPIASSCMNTEFRGVAPAPMPASSSPTSSQTALSSAASTQTASSTATTTSAPSSTQSPEGSPTSSQTRAPTLTPPSTATPSGSGSSTGSVSQTGTLSSTSTGTGTSTTSISATGTGSETASGSQTGSLSFSPSVTPSASVTASLSVTPPTSATRSATSTATASRSPSPIATASRSISETKTTTRTSTSSPTSPKSPTRTPSSSDTASLSASSSSSDTASISATSSAASTSSTSQTPAASISATLTLSTTSTASRTASHTLSMSASTSFSSSASETGTVAESSSTTPTRSGTPSFTRTRSNTPTLTPSVSPEVGRIMTVLQDVFPRALAAGASGDIFVTDTTSHIVWVLVSDTGRVMRFAGTARGFSGDWGPASSASLRDPWGLAVSDSLNVLLIADTSNHRIRAVSLSSGMIYTIAGTGFAATTGNGGSATAASVNAPRGVVASPDGTVFFSETGGHVVRAIQGGNIRTVAGTPGAAGYAPGVLPALSSLLSGPSHLALMDGAASPDTLFIADADNSVVRALSLRTGMLSTVAGNGTYGFSPDGTLASRAALTRVLGITVDATGVVYFSDSGYGVQDNNGGNSCVRAVGLDGTLRAVAGRCNVPSHPFDDDLPAISITLDEPCGLALVPGTRRLYIGDYGHRAVRVVTLGAPASGSPTSTTAPTASKTGLPSPSPAVVSLSKRPSMEASKSRTPTRSRTATRTRTRTRTRSATASKSRSRKAKRRV